VVAEGGSFEGDAVDLAADGALLVRDQRGQMLRVMAADVERCTLV
jgi:hypothetical protein